MTPYFPLPATAPPGAPMCWSRQYEESTTEGGQECQTCSFKDTCKPEFLRLNGMPPAPPPLMSLPLIQPGITTTAPTYYTPPTPPTRYVNPAFQNSPPTQSYTYNPYQQPVGQSTQNQSPIDIFQIKPMVLMKPPPTEQVWWVYPGEKTSTRLGKNVVLHAGAAIFRELMSFFLNWTWPPNIQ